MFFLTENFWCLLGAKFVMNLVALGMQFQIVRIQTSSVWFSNRICRWHTWDIGVNIYRWIIICPRHWSPAAEFNFTGKPAVVGDETILYEHHLLWNGWKLGPFNLHFAQIWVCRRFNADAPGTHGNRSPNIFSCNRRLRRKQAGGIWEPGFPVVPGGSPGRNTPSRLLHATGTEMSSGLMGSYSNVTFLPTYLSIEHLGK